MIRNFPIPTVLFDPQDVLDAASRAEVAASAANAAPTSWADFQSTPFIDMLDGAVVAFNGVQFQRDRAAAIVSLPAGAGWKPFGGLSVAAFDGDVAGIATAGAAEYGSIHWPNEPATGYRNFFGQEKYDSASWDRVMVGSQASPVDDPRPVTALVKWSAADRDVDTGAWDQAAYFAINKISGGAYGSALTGYVRYDGGNGDAVGVYGRVDTRVTEAQAFAGWFQTNVYNGNVNRACGVEIDVRNHTSPVAWMAGTGAGAVTSINMVCSGDLGATHGLRVPDQPSDANARAWTMFMVGKDTVFPADENGNGEVFRIRGSSSTAKRYAVFKVGDSEGTHYFSQGFDLRLGQFTANNAIQLARDQKIVWGDSAGPGGAHVTINAAGRFNLSNTTISINDTKVIGTQGAAVANATDAATAITQLNTLLARLRAHGLIAT